MKQFHKYCCAFYNILLQVKLYKMQLWLICIVSSTWYLYSESRKRRVLLTIYTSFTPFLCVYLLYVDIVYCQNRTTILDKIVVYVHYSRFSIKICFIHLNVNIKRALKAKLLKFMNMYCQYCVYSNRIEHLQQSHLRRFS